MTAVVDVVDISSCTNGSITVNASGGDSNYTYAYVTTGTSVTAVDFVASITFSVTPGNDGDYDVYVWDNNAVDPHCEYMETVTVGPATPITFTSTPTDPLCYNGVGSIEVTISSGDNPYTIQIIDLDNGGASDQTDTNVIATTQSYYNLSSGNYTIIVTDLYSCSVTDTPVNIANPDELTGDVIGVTPATCTGDPNDFGFQFIPYTTTLGTVEFSADGGATWIGDNSTPGTSDRFTGYTSGQTVYPSMRTVSGGVTVCQTDLPAFIIPYPLDDLDITVLAIVVNCNELQVTVQGGQGTPDYEYTYSEDPANFNPATPIHPWTTPAKGLLDPHTFAGLVPGRSYVFYVRDNVGCVRQSNVNVNDLITVPLEITTASEPSCAAASDGSIIFTVTDNTAPFGNEFRWTVYDVSGGTPVAVAYSGGGGAAINQPYTSPQDVTINSLPAGNYFIDVIEVDGGVDSCRGASENLLLDELNPITANLNKLRDISCNTPGLISIENISGGGGMFTYTVTGPAPFATITATPDNPVEIPANSPAGNYNVTITDQFGCFADLGPINLNLTPNPTIDSMVVDNCASPTSLTINATSTAAQILYSIDGGVNYVDNSGVFNNVTPGNYNVAIIDSNGCTDTDTVDVYPVLEVNVSLTKLLDCTATPDAQIIMEVTFGSGNYDYQITNGAGIVISKAALPSNPYVFNATVAEDYVITIYDNNTSGPECTRVFPVTVPVIVTPVFTEAHIDITCNGASDGTITLTETDNGINPLTYSISPAAGSFNGATNTFEDLPAATYTVTGTGTNGCTFDIAGIVIGEPVAMAVTLDPIVDFACTIGNNPNNASISVASVSGGSSTYVRYEFINDQGTPATGDDVTVQDGTNTVYTETNTIGGTYIINVYDDNGCTGTTTATILPFVEITDPSVTIDNSVTCNPGNDAQVSIGITLNPVTGTPNIEYSVVGTDNAYSSLNQVSNVFGSLGIGNYEVTVTNTDTGCLVQTAFEIEDPNTFEIDATTVDVVCFGDDGSVSFTINDPVSPYTNGFTWQIYNSQGTAAIGDDVLIVGANGVSANVGPTVPFAIGAGEYRVEVTQDSDPSCVSSEPFTIAGPNSLITANTNVDPITCVGNDGVIEIIDVLGGWGGYDYYVGIVAPASAASFVTGPRFDNLAPGTYQAWVIDQNGCQREVQNAIVLADPTPINASIQINQPNCTNFEGEIEVTAGITGGQGSNYTYQLIKNGTPTGAPQNTRVFTGLDNGSYQVQVTDQWTCTFTTTAEILYEPIVPLATVVKTIDCSATPGGEITIIQNGGSGNFDYSVTYPDGFTVVLNSTGIFNGMDQVGDYLFTVTDQTVGHACSTTITQRLEPAVTPVFTEAHIDITCNGASDGTITLTETDNGINPLTYSISPAAGSFNGATNTFEDLPAATYTVTGTGTNGCTFDIAGIVIGEPVAMAVTLDPIVDFACTIGNNPNNASISVASVSGGSSTYVRYEFINDQGTPATGDDVTVQDGTNTVYTETNTIGGTYIINVYDDNGCTGTTTATILPFVEITDPSVTIDNSVTCNPGNDAQVSIGITLNPVTGTPNIEYSVVGTDNAYSSLNQVSNVFGSLGIGNYEVTVTNTDTGCLVQTAFEIEDPNTFEIDATTVDVVCFGDDGSVSFTINDPVSPYTNGFTWQIYNSQGTAAIGDDVLIVGANGVSANVGPTVPFAIGAGEYRVEVTQDSDPSCVSSEPFTIAGPNSLITANTNVDPITCVGNDGVIEIIDVLGGWGGYDYYVGIVAPASAASFVTGPRFDNLAPGTYQAWVIDQNGCQREVQNAIVLADPTPINASIQINQPNCTNFEGEIEVTAGITGGQGSNYTYQLIKNGTPTGAPQNTRVFTGLDNGSYQVQVTDQWTCTFTTTAEILYEPIVPLATVVKTIDCSATPGGEITIIQNGGSGNFDYSVTYPDGFTVVLNSTGIFNGMDQVGDYLFTVTDQDAAQGCPTDITQRLEDAVLPILNVDTLTDVTCNGADDGTISMSVTDNGVGPYTFMIILGPGSSATFPIAATSSNATSAVFNSLEGSIAGITYTIEARGANNCVVTTDVTITESDIITVNPIDIVQYGCTNGNNTNNANISFVNASGGTNTFVRYVFIRDGSVVQDGPNTAYFETDGAGGDYEIRVYDDAGCSALSTTETVLPFVEINGPTVTTTQDAACAPLNNAQIEVGVTVTPSGPTPNLEYTVTGINVAYSQTTTSTNNPETFTALEFGNYRVSITNLDTGCVIETVHTIDDPDVIEVIATKLTDEECLNNGVDDGSFSIAINDYTGNYAYQVYDINDNPIVGAGFSGTGNTVAALPPITNLPGGVYYLRVTATDAPLCEDDSNVITVLAPSAPITATIREESSVSCSNDQGRILIDPTGGEGPYTIVLDDTTSQTYTETNVEAFIFEGLSAGSFHVTITDAFGCVLSDNIDLIRPDDIVATIADTPLTCFDENTASVTASINARNVTPVYQYRLNRYNDLAGSSLLQTSALQNVNAFNGLAAGFYSITVTDDVSCSDETSIVEIVNPTEVEAQLIRTSPLTCVTGVEFELSATGGTGTYEYSIDDATWVSMTGNSVNLPLSGIMSAGIYSYYVRDAINLCTAALSNSIEEDVIEPLTLIVDSSAAVINCNGENTAVIYAEADGGLGNYMYELFTDAALTNSVTGAAQNNGEFSGLSEGTYYVNVTSDDCTAPAEEVIITEPETLSIIDPNDFTNVSCFGANDGTITVELEGGVAPYQYAISPNLNKFDEENVFTDLEGSPSGITYTVIAQDSNGCFIELQYTIVEPDVLDVSAIALPEVCEGEENGSIELTIAGGTAPYSTRLSSETNFVQDRTNLSNLAAGSYIIFVRDVMGCEENVSLTVDPGVNLSATVEPVYGCNGDIPNNYINIALEDTSIVDEVLYGLDSTDPGDMQLNPYFRDIAPGTHYIAISHANGCVTTHDFEIEDFEPLTITVDQTNINEITATVAGGKEAYTIFFGDVNNGSDNTYFINRTDTYVVTVVDENGCEATASIDMEFIDIEIPNFFTPNGDGENEYWKPRNDEGFPEILTIIFDRYGREVYRIGQGDRGWDGFYKQTELPTGDYWYTIKLNGENDDREFVGHFTLYR